MIRVRRELISIPNILAGILLGAATPSWAIVLAAASVWPVVFCGYVAIFQRNRVIARAVKFKLKQARLLFGSPRMTSYAIEFITALATTVPIAVIVFGMKSLVP